MTPLSFREKYATISKQESFYEGLFVTAVKTTGIFCRPSCRARKPKAENVVFYTGAHEALGYGFRACKVCRPMEKEHQTPEPIAELFESNAQKSVSVD